MRQLNINEYYELGKHVEGVERELNAVGNNGIPINSVAWALVILRWKFQQILQEPCVLLTASQRAGNAVIAAINERVSEDIDEVFKKDKSELIYPWQITPITAALANFQTILKNDMPEMSTFAVSQIGILRTDDLINNAFRQIAEPLRALLQERAKADIIEAGKCLAFRLSTASAFHACRAVEVGIDQYFEALTGKPYEVSAKGGNNNWGAKTDALVKAKADEKVTEFLTHIRKQYRNPVTHPEVVVGEHEAVDLFIAALSAISMMLGATKTIAEKNHPILPGLGDGLGEWYAAATGESIGDISPNGGEHPLGLQTGTTETLKGGEES